MPPISLLPAATDTDPSGLLVFVSGGTTEKITLQRLLNALSLVDMSLSSPRGGLFIHASGEVDLVAGGSNIIGFIPSTSFNIVSPAGEPIFVYSPLGDVTLNARGGNAVLFCGLDPLGSPAIQHTGLFETNQTSAASTPGTVVGKFPIYDLSGTLIGYAPLYDTIT